MVYTFDPGTPNSKGKKISELETSMDYRVRNLVSENKFQDSQSYLMRSCLNQYHHHLLCSLSCSLSLSLTHSACTAECCSLRSSPLCVLRQPFSH